MIIFLGSTRPAKVEGAREAILAIAERDERFRHAELRPYDLGQAGPAMPMTEEAIIDGARRRAAALLEAPLRDARQANDGATFVVGVEGGLDRLRFDPDVSDGPTYMLKTWACVSDGTRWSYGSGGAIALPSAIARLVTDGRELGDIIDALAGAGTRATRGAWGVLTNDLVSRRDAFRLAVLSAFAPFFNAELYSGKGLEIRG